MKRRIIIPAAGSAARFGGIPKELLPIGQNECSLVHAIRLAKSFDADPVVITAPWKEVLHRSVMNMADLAEIESMPQRDPNKDLLGAIETGLEAGRPGGLILADTVATLAEPWAFLPMPLKAKDLLFGVFRTLEPERFSIVTPDGIVTKKPNAGGNLAWGMILWSADVTDFLMTQPEEHYDRAFEAAMKRFSWGMFKLESYYDLGSFKAYKDFLNRHEPRYFLGCDLAAAPEKPTVPWSPFKP